MSVSVNDIVQLEVEEGTAGGKTNRAVLRGRGESLKAYCLRPIFNQPDLRCTSPAGYRTSHLGTGACNRHGGADRTPTMSNGMQAYATKNRLKAQIDKYLELDRGQLLDMTRELAFMKAMLEEQMERFPDPEDENYAMWFHRATELIGTMGTLVDKISRTDSRNTLTAAQVLYLKVTMADILMKYIVDPAMRQRATIELANRVGGMDTPTDVKPSEGIY